MGHAQCVTDVDPLLSSDAREVCIHVVPLPASIMLATASCLHVFGTHAPSSSHHRMLWRYHALKQPCRIYEGPAALL